MLIPNELGFLLFPPHDCKHQTTDDNYSLEMKLTNNCEILNLSFVFMYNIYQSTDLTI